jgi:hypothetical protein
VKGSPYSPSEPSGVPRSRPGGCESLARPTGGRGRRSGGESLEAYLERLGKASPAEPTDLSRLFSPALPSTTQSAPPTTTS